MQLADFGYEDRLIERIALKELLRLVTPQQRKVICLRLEGHTYREVGQRLGVGGQRALQLESNAMHRLRHPKRLRPIKDTTPLPMPAIVKAPEFDRDAFLEHMRLLIRLRGEAYAKAEADAYAMELRATRHLAELAKPPQPPSAEELARRAAREAEAAAQRARWEAECAAKQRQAAEAMQALLDSRNHEAAAAVGWQAHIDLVRAAHNVGAGEDYQRQLQIGLARREWATVRTAFATEEFRKVRMLRTIHVYGWRLDEGQQYWLPTSVLEQMTVRRPLQEATQ